MVNPGQLFFLALCVIGVGVLVFVNWPRKMKADCPICYKTGLEIDRQMVDFKHSELPNNSQAMEGSHIVASIREQFEVKFYCKSCDANYVKVVSQTR